VTSLIQPKSNLRLIRQLDTTFVKALKKRIQEDPSGPGVPPVAVLCINTSKEDFVERLKDSYRYEILGGQHTVAAKSELFKEHQANMLFSTILADVYGGLSDKEALRLASRHNRNGHFVHKMSHKDYVSIYKIMSGGYHHALGYQTLNVTEFWKLSMWAYLTSLLWLIKQQVLLCKSAYQ